MGLRHERVTKWFQPLETEIVCLPMFYVNEDYLARSLMTFVTFCSQEAAIYTLNQINTSTVVMVSKNLKGNKKIIP